MPKCLRVIRFDDSDDHVYDHTATPDEWAVSGGQLFAGITSAELKGKTRQAFANGFLGASSLGRATFASVADCAQSDLDDLQVLLVDGFLHKLGAPGLTTAQEAAEAEITFALDLCADQPVNTIFTVRRVLDEAGEIREEFRTIAAPRGEPQHARIWEVVDDDA